MGAVQKISNPNEQNIEKNRLDLGLNARSRTKSMSAYFNHAASGAASIVKY